MISIIIPVKDRLDHLQECIPSWVSQMSCDREIIIVDYNCPQSSGAWVKENYPGVRVIRAQVKSKHWNLCEARNLGIRFAKNEILGIFDADTIMSAGFIDDCMSRITNDNFLCGYPIGKAHGCCVVSAKNMYAVGGYNEYLSGWGFDDQDLYNRLMNGNFHERNKKFSYADLAMIGFDENLIDLIRHEDILRTKYQKHKTIQASNHINSHVALHSSLFRGLESNFIKGVEL